VKLQCESMSFSADFKNAFSPKVLRLLVLDEDFFSRQPGVFV
jgi:hypothetical protein